MKPSSQRVIAFSPPDISEADIKAVSDALRSGWITTGPRTKELEVELSHFTHADGVACLASATSALECALRALDIGPGDEVITSAYTYSASCSVICHVGASPVICDTAPGTFEMDYSALGELITEKTKAVIPVDIAGRMCDYDRLVDVLVAKKDLWQPKDGFQSCFDRVIILADAAHSLGASYHGRPSGSVADFTAFSFHAVKNLTTAEGGALAWRIPEETPQRNNASAVLNDVSRNPITFDSGAFYHALMLLSLHGQSKDALAKSDAASWEYDIVFPGWKCNMTDLTAALGRSQLSRYPALLQRRQDIVSRYENKLQDMPVTLLHHRGESFSSSCHLMLVRLTGKDEGFRNEVIKKMAAKGVATNVHYKPLPLLTAYRDLGFNIIDYPNAFAMYENEITLPLHTLLSDEDVDYVVESFKKAYAETEMGLLEASEDSR